MTTTRSTTILSTVVSRAAVPLRLLLLVVVLAAAASMDSLVSAADGASAKASATTSSSGLEPTIGDTANDHDNNDDDDYESSALALPQKQQKQQKQQQEEDLQNHLGFLKNDNHHEYQYREHEATSSTARTTANRPQLLLRGGHSSASSSSSSSLTSSESASNDQRIISDVRRRVLRRRIGRGGGGEKESSAKQKRKMDGDDPAPATAVPVGIGSGPSESDSELDTESCLDHPTKSACESSSSSPHGNSTPSPCCRWRRRQRGKRGQCVRVSKRVCENRLKNTKKWQAEESAEDGYKNEGEGSAVVCPDVPPGTIGICVESCTVGSCPEGQLCCSNGCGHTCKDGIAKPRKREEEEKEEEGGGKEPLEAEGKDLVCPKLPPGKIGICAELCTVGSCPEGQLCCSNGCGHTCKDGIAKPRKREEEEKEEEGGKEPLEAEGMDLVCPELPPGTIGICVERCTVGSCPEGQLCCSNGCGKACANGVSPMLANPRPYPPIIFKEEKKVAALP